MKLALVRGKSYLRKDKSVVEFEFINERTGLAMVHDLGEYDTAKLFGVRPDELEEYNSSNVRSSPLST